MYCIDFEYDDKRLSDYGCIVCHINSDAGLNTVNIGSQITFNTINLPLQNKFKIMSTQYNEAYTTTFEISKFNCNNRDDCVFSQEEISVLMRWLNKKKYKKFKMIYQNGECANIYYMGTFNVQLITIAGDVIGMELTLQTNAPFGYYEPVECVMEFDTVDKEILVFDISDEIGYIYPNNVTIKCLEEGNLVIHNSKDEESRNTVINKCKKNEIITLDGENKIITSSKTHSTLYNDFSYDFIRISNTNEDGIDDNQNIFTVSLPCTISFTYSPICKMGIV